MHAKSEVFSYILIFKDPINGIKSGISWIGWLPLIKYISLGGCSQIRDYN